MDCFRLLLSGKGFSPIGQSSSTAPSSSFSSSSRGRIAFLESTTTSWVFVQGHTVKPCKCSTGVKGNHVSSYRTFLAHEPSNRNEGLDIKILRPSEFTSFHYDYLMESLERMEDITKKSEVMRLEQDILLHIERLGALDLFHTCLSRMTKIHSIESFPTSPLTTECKDNHAPSVSLQLEKIMIPSGRKIDRKLKRQRSLRVSRVSCSTTFEDVTSRDDGSLQKALSHKRTRQLVAKSEAEMSKWVKELSRLEKIKTSMKEKMGNVSLSTWAEAAGIEKEALRKHLSFGWHSRDKLLKSIRPLVLYLARLYRGQGICLNDLLQAGFIGVLIGAERYDQTKGNRFATYTQYWIKKLMSTLVARHSRGIKIPSRLSEIITKMKKARRVLHNHNGRYPNDEEISYYTGISLANVRLARKCSRVPASLDQKVGETMLVKLTDIIPDTSISTPEEITLRHNLRKEVYEILGGLDQREKQVLILRFGLIDGKRMSLEEIGKVYKVSKERIRRIEKAAMTKIKTTEIQSRLSPFLRV